MFIKKKKKKTNFECNKLRGLASSRHPNQKKKKKTFFLSFFPFFLPRVSHLSEEKKKKQRIKTTSDRWYCIFFFCGGGGYLKELKIVSPKTESKAGRQAGREADIGSLHVVASFGQARRWCRQREAAFGLLYLPASSSPPFYPVRSFVRLEA